MPKTQQERSADYRKRRAEAKQSELREWVDQPVAEKYRALGGKAWLVPAIKRAKVKKEPK